MSESLSLLSHPVSPRRRYPLEYKRQVVQESMASGASIARVAMGHGINANQLHNWRWQYRRGNFEPMTQGPILLPVEIKAVPVMQAHEPAKIIDGLQSLPRAGQIELTFAAARVVIHGAPDVSTLRCVIEALSA